MRNDWNFSIRLAKCKPYLNVKLYIASVQHLFKIQNVFEKIVKVEVVDNSFLLTLEEKLEIEF